MQKLRLSLIQTSLHWEDKEANLSHFEELLTGIGNTDLILLPEMFSTGFTMHPEQLWDEPEGKTLQWMREMASNTAAAISGSIIVRENNQYYNRLYFVHPNGDYHTYDKKHLFTLAGEEKVYTGGNSLLTVNYKGWKIKPLVCYDLRFPVWCRNTDDVDLIYFVANWPERRSMPWLALLKARAIENMCFVAGLNRVGEDGNGVAHSGDSGVYDELGNPVCSLTPHSKEVKTVELDRERMLESRKRFQFLNDRDNFKVLD